WRRDASALTVLTLIGLTLIGLTLIGLTLAVLTLALPIDVAVRLLRRILLGLRLVLLVLALAHRRRRGLAEVVLVLVGRREELVAAESAPPLPPAEHRRAALGLVFAQVVVAEVATRRALQRLVAEVTHFLAVAVEALDQRRRRLQVAHADQRARDLEAHALVAVLHRRLELRDRAAVVDATEHPCARAARLGILVAQAAQQRRNRGLAGLREPHQVLQQLVAVLVGNLLHAGFDFFRHQRVGLDVRRIHATGGRAAAEHEQQRGDRQGRDPHGVDLEGKRWGRTHRAKPPPPTTAA